MIEALFVRIPRCLFEPVAVIGLMGLIIFLCLHWKKDRGETLLLASAILFMIGWRVLMPINADRYALLLVPLAIYFSVTAIKDISDFCRRYCRYFPDYHILCTILLIICVLRSFHNSSSTGWQMFEMIKAMKEQTKGSEQKIRLVSDHDISCFVGDHFDVKVFQISKTFRFSDLPSADYYLLKLNRKIKQYDKDATNYLELKKFCPAKEKYGYYLLKKKEK